MKHLLLSGVLAFALVFTACQSDSDVNAPVPTPSNTEYSAAMDMAEMLDLSIEQHGQIDEMFYMDEDMGILLDDAQLFTFNGMIDAFDVGGERDMIGRRGGVVDMAALMYFRLIMKACPDHPEETIQAVRELIRASHQARLQIIKDNVDTRELIPDLLKAEHDKLMTAIDDLIGQPCIDAIEALKADIQAKREEMRAKWLERRINAQVAFFTKLLDLDDAQQAALKALLMKQHEDIAKLREQYKGDPEGFRAALAEYMAGFDEAFKALLTPEQLELYEKFKEGRGTKRDPDINPLDKELEFYTKFLELTPEQVAQLKALLEARDAAMKKAFEDYRHDRKALMNAMREIQKTFQTGLEGLLTPEQLEKLKKGHRGGRIGG